MLALIGIVFISLRPRYVLQLWPWAIPVLVAAQFAVPGCARNLPILVRQADCGRRRAGARRDLESHRGDQGRLADIGPSLSEFSRHPSWDRDSGLASPTTPTSERTDPRRSVAEDAARDRAGGSDRPVLDLALAIKRPFGRARRAARSRGWRAVAFTASLPPTPSRWSSTTLSRSLSRRFCSSSSSRWLRRTARASARLAHRRCCGFSRPVASRIERQPRERLSTTQLRPHGGVVAARRSTERVPGVRRHHCERCGSLRARWSARKRRYHQRYPM